MTSSMSTGPVHAKMYKDAQAIPANPFECPLGFSLHSWDGVNGMEQMVLLLGILDVGLQ